MLDKLYIFTLLSTYNMITLNVNLCKLFLSSLELDLNVHSGRQILFISIANLLCCGVIFIFTGAGIDQTRHRHNTLAGQRHKVNAGQRTLHIKIHRGFPTLTDEALEMSVTTESWKPHHRFVYHDHTCEVKISFHPTNKIVIEGCVIRAKSGSGPNHFITCHIRKSKGKAASHLGYPVHAFWYCACLLTSMAYWDE